MDRVTELTSSSRNSAHILAKREPGFDEKVLNSLKRIKGVVEVDQVYGCPYDIVVKSSVQQMDKRLFLDEKMGTREKIMQILRK